MSEALVSLCWTAICDCVMLAVRQVLFGKSAQQEYNNEQR